MLLFDNHNLILYLFIQDFVLLSLYFQGDINACDLLLAVFVQG